MNGVRRRGGQRKRWEYNIKEWRGLRVSESLKSLNDRKGWCEGIGRSVIALLRLTEVMEYVHVEKTYE